MVNAQNPYLSALYKASTALTVVAPIVFAQGTQAADNVFPSSHQAFNRATNTFFVIDEDTLKVASGGPFDAYYYLQIEFGENGAPVDLDLSDKFEFTRRIRGIIDDKIDENRSESFDPNDHLRAEVQTTIEKALIENRIEPYDEGRYAATGNIFRRDYDPETGNLELESVQLIPNGQGDSLAAISIKGEFEAQSGEITHQVTIHALVNGQLVTAEGPEVARKSDSWHELGVDKEIYQEQVQTLQGSRGPNFGLNQ